MLIVDFCMLRSSPTILYLYLGLNMFCYGYGINGHKNNNVIQINVFCYVSFFNIAEVDVVVKYVKKILDSKFCGKRLQPSDIGIISPYRRQV
jgi:hypothetical protein